VLYVPTLHHLKTAKALDVNVPPTLLEFDQLVATLRRVLAHRK
jgi:hypothetical protein